MIVYCDHHENNGDKPVRQAVMVINYKSLTKFSHTPIYQVIAPDTIKINFLDSICIKQKCKIIDAIHPKANIFPNPDPDNKLNSNIYDVNASQIKTPEVKYDDNLGVFAVKPPQTKGNIGLYNLISAFILSTPAYSSYVAIPNICGNGERKWLEIQAYAKQSVNTTVSFEFKYDKGEASAQNEHMKKSWYNYIPFFGEKVGDKWPKVKVGGEWNLGVKSEIEYNETKVALEAKSSDFEGVSTFLNGIMTCFTSLKAFYESKGSDNKIEFTPPKIELELKSENKESIEYPSIYFDNSFNLKFDPLLAVEFKVDVIDWLAKVFGTPAFGKFLQSCRAKARKGIDKGNFSGSAELGIDFSVKGTIDTNNKDEPDSSGICINYKPQLEQTATSYIDQSKVSASGSLNGNIEFKLEGYAKAKGKVSLSVFQVSAKAGVLAYLKASMGAQLNIEASQTRGQDLATKIGGQVYFDGLVIYYATYLDVKFGDDTGTVHGGGQQGSNPQDNNINLENKLGSISASKDEATIKAKLENTVVLIEPCKWPADPSNNKIDKLLAKKAVI